MQPFNHPPTSLSVSPSSPSITLSFTHQSTTHPFIRLSVIHLLHHPAVHPPSHKVTWVRLAQSVYRLATGWTVRGSNPCGGEIFRTRPDRRWIPSSLLYNRYRVFTGGKAAGRGVDHPPHLALRLRKE